MLLVEAIVGLVVFAMIVISVYQSLAYQRRLAEVSLRSTVARSIAQSVLEQTRNATYDTLRDATTVTFRIGDADVVFTKGTALAVSHKYQYTGQTKADNLPVTITFNTADQNPTYGRAMLISVEYTCPRLPNTGGTFSGRLAYLKSSYMETD